MLSVTINIMANLFNIKWRSSIFLSVRSEESTDDSTLLA